jgi:hypothetical protein
LCAIGRPCSGRPRRRAPALVGGARAIHRPLRDDRDDRVDLRVDAIDLREVRRQRLARRELLRADEARHLDSAQRADVGRHEQ